MNFTEYMNKKIYASAISPGNSVLAIGEKKQQFDSAFTVDIEGGDVNLDLNHDSLVQVISHPFDVIRAGEILEHLTSDFRVLQEIHQLLAENGTLLVTVPFHGVADYHVRLHNKWSITQLLNVAGFEIVRYVPRKAPRMDRFIAYIRGFFGLFGFPKDAINEMFVKLNPLLPIRPNGGYFFCKKSKAYELSEVNRAQFDSRKLQEEK